MTMDQAEWTWLKPHLERDALIWVGPSLELLQVAKTNATAKQIVQEFNIQWTPGPTAPVPSPPATNQAK